MSWNACAFLSGASSVYTHIHITVTSDMSGDRFDTKAYQPSLQNNLVVNSRADMKNVPPNFEQVTLAILDLVKFARVTCSKLGSRF